MHISTEAFRCNANISEISFPSPLLSIGQQAFENQDSLKRVVLPADLQSVGLMAFRDCDNLISVTLSNPATEYGYRVFCSCERLQSINFPEEMRTIPDNFLENTAITEAVILGTVTAIGESAFAVCPYLAEVTLPEGLISIGSSGFSSCPELTTLNLPSTLQTLGDSALHGNPKLSFPNDDGEAFPWPAAMLDGGSVGEQAFSSSELTSITIPEGWTKPFCMW